MQNTKYIAQLIRGAKSGNRKALKLLFDTYALEMLTLSNRITGNRQDAEDIIQEAFLKAFGQLHKLKDPQKFRPWLKRIVLNESLQKVKKKMIWEPVSEGSVSETEAEEKWYLGIPFEAIKRAIAQLPDGCRQIFTLYLLEDYKHREIADLLSISISTSKSQYRYALGLMKELLTKNQKR